MIDAPLAALDLEMTGLDPRRERICEVAVVRRVGGEVSRAAWLVRPGVPVSPGALAIHGLDDAALSSAEPFEAIAAQVRAQLDGCVLVGHDLRRDFNFLAPAFASAGVPWSPPPVLDTHLIARRLFVFLKGDLASLCAALGVPRPTGHRALPDAEQALGVFDALFSRLGDDNMTVRSLIQRVRDRARGSAVRAGHKRTITEAFRAGQEVWLDYQSPSDAPYGVRARRVRLARIRFPVVEGFCALRREVRCFHVDRIHGVRVVEGEE